MHGPSTLPLNPAYKNIVHPYKMLLYVLAKSPLYRFDIVIYVEGMGNEN